MSADRTPPPETPEGPAWELFMEIRRAEEKERQPRGRGNRRPRDELLDLYPARGARRAVTSRHRSDATLIAHIGGSPGSGSV